MFGFGKHPYVKYINGLIKKVKDLRSYDDLSTALDELRLAIEKLHTISVRRGELKKSITTAQQNQKSLILLAHGAGPHAQNFRQELEGSKIKIENYLRQLNSLSEDAKAITKKFGSLDSMLDTQRKIEAALRKYSP